MVSESNKMSKFASRDMFFLSKLYETWILDDNTDQR